MDVNCDPNQFVAVATPIAEVLDAELKSVGAGTLNMETRDETPTESGARITTYARNLRQQWASWGILGLQELPTHHVQASEFFHIGHIELSANPVTCADGYSGDGITCWAREFHTSIHLWDAGELGIIANDALWDWIPGSVISAFIGKERNDIIHRKILGARLKNRHSGKIFPFWTVHTSATEDADRINEEVPDIVRIIRQFQIPTDQLPVLVGDFNCWAWPPSARATLLADFYPVGGLQSIDRIYAGRRTSFSGTGEIWVAEQASDQRIDFGNPTDHLASVTHLFPVTPASPAEDVSLISPVALDPSNHCP